MSRSGAEEGRDRVLAAADSPVRLTAEGVTIHLKPSGSGSLREALRDALGDGRVLLVLRDVHAAKPPGALFSVYLELPEGARGVAAQAEWRAGYLNFFNFQREGKRGLVSFDVTELIRKLLTGGAPLRDASVTIRPVSRPAPDAEPAVGGAELIQHRF